MQPWFCLLNHLKATATAFKFFVCYFIKSVTIERNLNIAPYFGGDNGTNLEYCSKHYVGHFYLPHPVDHYTEEVTQYEDIQG